MHVDDRPDLPRHRLASRLSLGPLGLILLSACLPTVRSCERIEVPVTYFTESPGGLVAFGLPYLMALALGVMVVVSAVRGFAPRRRGILWASVGIGVCGLESVVLVGAGLVNMLKDRLALALTLVGSGALVLGLFGFVYGVRAVGWRALSRLLLAFGCFALASPVGAMTAAATIDDAFGHPQRPQSGSGAWLFLVASVVSIAIGAWGSTREPNVTERSARPAGETPDELGTRGAFR